MEGECPDSADRYGAGARLRTLLRLSLSEALSPLSDAAGFPHNVMISTDF
jgi:hypothetical protein